MPGRAGRLDFIDDLALEIGATFDGTIALTNDDNTAINLTGFTVLWQVRDHAGATVAILNLATYCTIPTPSNGIIVFSVPRSVTLLLSATQGTTDLLLTQGDYGRFEIRGDFDIVETVSK